MDNNKKINIPNYHFRDPLVAQEAVAPKVYGTIPSSCSSKTHECALASFKIRISSSLKVLKRNITLGWEVFVSIIKEGFTKLLQLISDLAHRILHIRRLSYHGLLESVATIENSQTDWSLNLALLKNSYKKTQDPQLKKQIEFMATNYLEKSAPIYLNMMKLLQRKIGVLFQVGPYTNYHYHRMGFRQNPGLGAEINKNLAFTHKSPLILTDTTEVTQFFPLNFHVIDSAISEAEWETTLTQALNAHFSKFAKEPRQAFSQAMNVSLLVDLTSSLEELVKTNGKREKEEAFEKQLDSIRTSLNCSFDRSIEKFRMQHPELSKISTSKFKKLLQQNSTCICRLTLDEIAGIKVLPVFTDLKGKKILQKHPAFLDFIEQTGLYIGAINMRKHILNGFNIRPDIKYPIKGPDAKDIPNKDVYFPDKLDLTKLALFDRFLAKVSSPEMHAYSPHLAILGESTLHLLKGLLNEISDKQWKKFQGHPIKREIIQTSLFKIKEHLATAELFMDDYSKYAQEIELVHCEIANLLTLTAPFEEKAFPTILPKQLANVPEELRPLIKAGLGKTAVNVFAGINAALLNLNPHPTRVFSTGFYYEQASFIGNDQRIENALQDSSLKQIDLYACQFNPNIEIDADHTHYAIRDVKEDIRQILWQKNENKQLTVAVDCTIDYINSPKVHDLLATFQEEIKDGKLNFVFFRSGQKFDMFGMDNYYGSPFYMVNNGKAPWDAFNSLTEDIAHKTDQLSLQWFSLAYKYTTEQMDSYRSAIFKNTREILDGVPPLLQPLGKESSQKIRISTADPEMECSFIDIKLIGKGHALKSRAIMGLFYKKCLAKGIKVHSRASFGFYHPNCIIISVNAEEGSSTIRINPGLNPEENQVIAGFIKELVNDARL
ncbi:hypothetical protein [Neochlamydia sp. S13]|uniref:hypothetical protein n=1 Tax=Neochlamydia sp. S13 TaxID=1353976 RepID=UPI000694687C|nr:hypothetical protein [Neochlamydia sp. S13]BBI18074.1 Uncharacterized protein NCS13_1_1879 [Neochlamydia sp. S13]